MTGLVTEYLVRQQLAAEQGDAFDEDISVILGGYVETLEEHERVFAWSLQER